jgi:uncharacterized protein YcbX
VAAASVAAIAYFVWGGIRLAFFARILSLMGVSGLFVYPLKSAKGIAVDRLEFDSVGVWLDRRWMLVDERGEFLSQRTSPKMALIEITPQGDHLRLAAPDMPACHVPMAAPAAGERSISVEIWSRHCNAEFVDAGGDGIDRWFSEFLRRPCRLVRMPRAAEGDGHAAVGIAPPSFVDGFAVHIVTQASLDALNAKLRQPVGIERFRPNIVINGAQPHAEDGWHQITAGALELDILGPCPRCAIPSIDQDSGRATKEPLRTLRSYRTFGSKIEFGQNARHRRPGTLRVGDAVTVRAYKSAQAV